MAEETTFFLAMLKDSILTPNSSMLDVVSVYQTYGNEYNLLDMNLMPILSLADSTPTHKIIFLMIRQADGGIPHCLHSLYLGFVNAKELFFPGDVIRKTIETLEDTEVLHFFFRVPGKTGTLYSFRKNVLWLKQNLSYKTMRNPNRSSNSLCREEVLPLQDLALIRSFDTGGLIFSQV